MAIVASTVMTEVRALLNDPTGAVYADTPVYALMNKAYKELQAKISSFGISTTKEVSTVIDVPAGTVALIDGALLPADLLYPVDLFERADGSTGLFDDMFEKAWDPQTVPGPYLKYWVWREDEIKFPGSSQNREVKINYVKSLGSITSGSSQILILGSVQWLAQRTAALAALLLGSNPTRSGALDADLNKPGGVWEDFKATLIKRRQGIPVRRRRTRYRVP